MNNVCKIAILSIMLAGITSHATLMADWTFAKNDTITTGLGAKSLDTGNFASATLTAQNITKSGSQVASVLLSHSGPTTYLVDYLYSANQDLSGSAAAVSMVLNCSSSLSISGLTAAFTYQHGPTAGTMAGIWTINGTQYTSSTLGSTGSITNTIGNVTLAQGLDTITFTLTGAPSGVNTNVDFSEFRLDYTSITVVPEPTQHALAGFAFILIGVGTIKYISRRNKPVA